MIGYKINSTVLKQRRRVIDFYCPAVKLAIEVDGGYHMTRSAKVYDQEKTSYLQGFGVKILRISNDDIMNRDINLLSRINPLLSIREGRVS